MAPSGENKWEEKLPDLPSYKKYKELDSVKVSNGGITFCNGLEKSNERDRYFCNKVSKLLKDLSAEPENKRKGNCHYFRHWFHEQVSKKYYEGKNINNKHVYGKLFDLVSEAVSKDPKLEPCRCYYSETNEGWKEEKDLHDYFKNFEYIKSNACNKKNCAEYLKYINYVNNLYMKYYDGYKACCEYDTIEPHCEPYFTCDEKYDPSALLPILKSAQEKSRRGEDNVVKDVVMEKPEVVVGSHAQGGTPPVTEEAAPDGSSTPLNISNEVTDDHSGDEETVYDVINSYYFQRFIVFVATVGMIICLYFYYKYTFLRPILRKKRKKEKKLHNRDYKLEYKLYDDDSKSSFIDAPREGLYFSYHPA
ncbi:PIR protein [Plasmodium vivax]|nr:PIR protein [Plasmodium vivax]